MQFTFNVTDIQYIGMKQSNMRKVDVYFDGVLEQADIDAYGPTTTKQVVIFSKIGLMVGSHTIKVVCNGTKNASSSSTVCAIDIFAYKAR